MTTFNPKTLFIGKLAILVLLTPAMYAQGKKHGLKIHDSKAMQGNIPVYRQCHENFQRIPADIMEKYRVIDHFSIFLSEIERRDNASQGKDGKK